MTLIELMFVLCLQQQKQNHKETYYYQRFIILRYFMEGEITSDSHINIVDEEEIQCKICFLKNTPLLRLCQCRGSIGFVHEQCLLKWITAKLQQMSVIHMPRCQVCMTPYSAELRNKKNRISFNEAFKRVKELSFWTIAIILITILGTIYLPYIEFTGFRSILYGGVDSYLMYLFSYVVFPCYFIKAGLQIFKRIQACWKDCQVRQVEIYLLPKEIYR